MTAIVVAGLFLCGGGCSPPPVPASKPATLPASQPVVLASDAQPPATAAPPPATAPTGAVPCVVTGAGELAIAGVPAFFPVYDSAARADIRAVVRATETVRVTWTITPSSELARVSLGGQRLLRLEGWAEPRARTFQLRSRVDVVPGRVWFRAGAPVVIVGARGDDLAVELAAPSSLTPTLVGAAPCARVAYDPSSRGLDPADEPMRGSKRLRPMGRFTLLDGPRGATVLSLETGPRWTDDDALGWIDAREGHTRVTGTRGFVSFDGWVATSGIVELTRLQSGTRARSPRILHAPPYTGDASRVVRDSEVTMTRGAASPGGGAGTVIGVVEAGAEIELYRRRGDHAAFWFEGREIEPPQGGDFWIRVVDVAPR